ncbi:hypothetical protein Ae201684P_016399 [Aphanomyces euteiches]|uniref:Uncharacterized protein n=1 Tax=Aphanomyces euteiches TaxID=100861 RepID=A0A6G0WCV0_9STRA|nr:hypothetical protein Ae201684_017072 [Aphanomyces euteiches]KAH9093777.1 hypothetical protein Ae201684P_016399 [Aphanomyces euteiches]
MSSVFGQRDLVETICQYQFGVHVDVRLFMTFPTYLKGSDPRCYDGWPSVKNEFKSWLATASTHQVGRILDALPELVRSVTLVSVVVGNVAALQAIHPSRSNLVKFDVDLLGLAAVGGHVPMLQYLLETVRRPHFWKQTASPFESHLDAVKYLVDVLHMEPQHGLFVACDRGHLEVLKFLYSRMHLSKMPELYGNAQDKSLYFIIAFARGYMDSIVPYLVDQLDGQLDIAVDMAVSKGHLPATKYLLERDSTYSSLAFEKAARLGTLDILEWIIDKKYTRNNDKAFETAAEFGQLQIVQFLQPHVKRLTLCEAYLKAATSRHRDVATYLTALATEDELVAWFERAVIQGNLPAVQFLYRPTPQHRRAISNAARYNHLDILQWLAAKEDPSTKKPSELQSSTIIMT